MNFFFTSQITSLFACLLLLSAISVDARRVRVRSKPPIQREESEEIPESESNEEDNHPQPAIQYYNANSNENIPQQQDRRLVLVSSDDDYNGYYGQQTARPRIDYNRPTAAPLVNSRIGGVTTPSPRTKDQATKTPPVQTIRNYNKVNDDGSFTFGYEAADGSFKEETRGTDCVVRGKYGYIDPDGNKREFTYVSGNPCDPNNPNEHESEEERDTSEENSNEPENVPQNYPKRPIRPVRPIHTTTSAPTTVFQSSYSHPSLQVESEEEEPEPIQVLQPQRTRNPTPVQIQHQYRPPQEVSIRQRPRITINTTPSPAVTPYQAVHPVSITPRPTYRGPIQTLPRTQPPATTYRPANKVTQQPAPISYSKSSSQPISFPQSTPNAIHSTTRRPIDFAAEFQKFQKEHNLPITTTTIRTTTPYRPYKPSPTPEVPATSNPIYESQLIYDPSSGQYDSALYQQLPQTEGDFQLSHRIQPYVHPLSSPAPQLVSLEQLAQVNPLYRRPQAQNPVPAQFSQQNYEKERENLQVVNSQQLFQQQQELQQQQLQQDRLEAARKAAQHAQQQIQQQQQQQQQQQRHRFQPSPPVPQSQGFYYIQPPSGQIDAFIRGHNLDF